jgi:hypothetical protein
LPEKYTGQNKRFKKIGGCPYEKSISAKTSLSHAGFIWHHDDQKKPTSAVAWGGICIRNLPP